MLDKLATMGLGLCCLAMLAGTGCASGKGEWRLAMMAYTFRNFTLFEAIDKTQSLDLNYMEGFSWHKISDAHGDAQLNPSAPPEAREAVRRKLAAAGIRMVNYYFHHLGKDEEETRGIFAFCKDMGIETIVAEPEPDKFDLVEKLADEYGINVALHNHPAPSAYWDVNVTYQTIKDRGSRIGVCADTGHWVRSGIDPVEAVRKLKGRIICLHLKDIETPTVKSRDVPWGTGVGNVRGVLEQLDRQGFAGVISIEYEHSPEDNMADVKQCIAYYNQVARELGR